MSSVFARLHPRLQSAIVARLGWSTLRQVQDLAGAALLDGNNAVVLAPTAGGKTEAALFPVLSRLLDEPPMGLAALYIAPIKALLNNQADRLGQYTEMVGLDRFVWHGDVASAGRKKFLAEPCALLMTTPESLEVMLVSKTTGARALFADLRFIVIDEIHALAGTDRGAHLMSVIERIAALSRHDIQRVGLSATVGNPSVIAAWLTGSSKRKVVVIDPPSVPSKRKLLVFYDPDPVALAEEAAKLAKGKKSLFFCQSRAATEAVAEQMRRFGTAVFVHHSAVSKEEREIAEERFHHGTNATIVATSTLELGIDVGDLDLVLQSDAPDTVSSFLQRMGRTGRRSGQTANTTFFCESSEAVLQAIALVELAKIRWVESVDVTDRCWSVLIHQILAMSLASDGVTLRDAWNQLSKVPDLRGIHLAEFERLVAWMLRDGSLLEASGRLVLGPKAERRFGRRNFMDLYAVFSSPQSYTVQTREGAPIGTLSQGFVDRLVDGISCFLLGGRAWAVEEVRHTDRRVVVSLAPRGREPTWGGFLPQFLGFTLCQRILALLCSDTPVSYLHESAAAVLAQQREHVSGMLQPERGGIEVDSKEIRWWTFAGGRINSTLRYALAAVGGDWKIVPDNYAVRVRGEDLSERALREAIDRLRELELWENDKLWAEVSANLPNYRLSKFQPLMPPWVEREILADHLIDVAGAWAFLSGDPRAAVRMPSFLPAPEEEAPPTVVVPDTRPPSARPTLPVVWVADSEGLVAVCQRLATEAAIGLDVETTLGTNALCLVQMACTETIFLVDALALHTLEPLAELLGNPRTVKVIHNATFECGVLGRYGITIENIFDTLTVSRRLRGKQDDGHSLKVVCERELGLVLDKEEQTSDWTRRPLTERQQAYAALDAEVLLALYGRFRASMIL